MGFRVIGIRDGIEDDDIRGLEFGDQYSIGAAGIGFSEWGEDR